MSRDGNGAKIRDVRCGGPVSALAFNGGDVGAPDDGGALGIVDGDGAVADKVLAEER